MAKTVNANKPVRRGKRRTRLKWSKESVKRDLLALHEKGYEMREKEIGETDSGLMAVTSMKIAIYNPRPDKHEFMTDWLFQVKSVCSGHNE